MLPSSSCRVTRRGSCSQAISLPWRSRVSPLARFVGSWNSNTPLPGSYFIRLLLWMSLNNRERPFFHHSGPSAGPCAPPKPSAKSWMGSDGETILSSPGTNCSTCFDDCGMANPPVGYDPALARKVAPDDIEPPDASLDPFLLQDSRVTCLPNGPVSRWAG